MEIFTLLCEVLAAMAISYVFLQKCIIGALKKFDDYKQEKEYDKLMDDQRRSDK